jgi:hypothetical protein
MPNLHRIGAVGDRKHRLSRRRAVPDLHGSLLLIVDPEALQASIGARLTELFHSDGYRGQYPTEEGLLPHGEPTGDEARRVFAIAEGLMKKVETLLP